MPATAKNSHLWTKEMAFYWHLVADQDINLFVMEGSNDRLRFARGMVQVGNRASAQQAHAKRHQ
jgi:hypothetical protein